MFQLSDFEAVCREVNNPDISEYEFFTESHGVKIYRLYHESSGLYSYKTYGTLDVDPEICAKVYMDLDYRKQWDSYVKALHYVEDDENTKQDEGEEENKSTEKCIYWRVAYPFPMSHRDYVYARDLKEVDLGGSRYWALLASPTQLAAVPDVSGVIRVNEFQQACALTADGKGGTRAFMKYFDNPGGMIPTWLINWGAKTGVPSFLNNMQKACHKYPEYLQKKAQAGS